DLKRSATVRATEKSLLRLLRREDFERIVGEQPAIATKILRYIARSLSLSLRKTSNVLSDSMHL
ncbi:MAG TPA: cyclic nucleotide-binding domain-containing protein, partial [Gammaproteobacteria bacterium]|nr:cyclic nucleotide-binding domain-containing protein [Gammaproteobacteria bacterium]